MDLSGKMCCVGSAHCDVLITRSEKSYRVCGVCVCGVCVVCVWCVCGVCVGVCVCV